MPFLHDMENYVIFLSFSGRKYDKSNCQNGQYRCMITNFYGGGGGQEWWMSGG